MPPEELDPEDSKEIRLHKDVSPGLNWNGTFSIDGVKQHFTYAIYNHLVLLRRSQRAEAAAAREAERLAVQLERERLAAVKTEEKAKRDLRIVELHVAGKSVSAISVETKSSVSTVRNTLERAGRTVENNNRRKHDDRVARGHEAVALQAQGLSRAEIGIRLNCGIETVKQLLSDAKFVADPSADPIRLDRAKQMAALLKTGVTRNRAEVELRLSASASKRASRDAFALGLLTDEHRE